MLEALAQARETLGTNVVVSLAAVILGLAFGWLAERSQFCFRAAVAEWADTQPSSTGSKTKTVQYLVAIAAAITFVQAAIAFGWIDLATSAYLATPVRPLAIIVGGLTFGVGMVLSGGCLSRLLVLAGTGNLRSWFTLLVAAIAAYASLRGILSYPRTGLEGLWELEAAAHGDQALLTPLAIAGIVSLAVLALIATTHLRKSATIANLFAGIAVAVAVLAGWLITGVIGNDDFEPTRLQSLSFTAPIGESVQYLMIQTGAEIRFGIALVAGLLVGSFVSAAFAGRLQLQGFRSESEPLRYALGGLLMGFGGVTAMGCAVGQGLTGMSTLAPAAPMALISIAVGAVLAMRFARVRLMFAPPRDHPSDNSELQPTASGSVPAAS